MKRIGFTIIELLTVIAIIAILAAIAFPVAARARENAYRSSDMTNMNALRSALQLYKADQGGFPPQLLGYVELYKFAPLTGQPIPANKTKSYLYPKRVDSIDTFRPSRIQAGMVDSTTAVWPQQDATALGSRPLLDLNGDGTINAADDYECARQAFGPGDGNVQRADGVAGDALFYKLSGYDVSSVPNPGGGVRYEIHYALFWTKWGLNNGGVFSACGSTPGNIHDDPRQLGYADPPDDTVLTWNSTYRDYTNAIPARDKRDIVLFLGGAARSYDSRQVFDYSWRLAP